MTNHVHLLLLPHQADALAKALRCVRMRYSLGPFPATHKRMELTIIGMHRFEAGLIVETWTSWDNLAALTQLGLLPAA
jgi:hypothetical protein